MGETNRVEVTGKKTKGGRKSPSFDKLYPLIRDRRYCTRQETPFRVNAEGLLLTPL